jgi:heptosyltransferase-1
VKTSSLGDILHAYPTLSYLREKFPDGRIDWVVEKKCQELVDHHPWVSNTLVIDTHSWRRGKNLKSLIQFFKTLRSNQYDLLVDLQGNFKSGLVTLFAKGVVKLGFGWKTVPEKINLVFTNQRANPPKGKNIREDLLYLIKHYFKDSSPYRDRPVLLKVNTPPPQLDVSGGTLICPGAHWKNKRLSQSALERFVALQPRPIFYAWGTEEERRFCETLSKIQGTVLPKLSLAELQHLMSKMRQVVAMDSLPLHLAGTTDVKTFSFFGPSSAKKYAPLGGNHEVVQGVCPYHVSFDKRCPYLRSCKTGACLSSIKN